METWSEVTSLIDEALAVERTRADIAASLKLARRAQALADESGQATAMAAARVAVARYRFRLGQYAQAQALAQQALDLTTPPDDENSIQHADALLLLGMCASETAPLEDAEQIMLQASDLAREIGHPVLRLRTLQNLADLYGLRGRFSLALAVADEARKVALQYELKEWLFFPLLTLALYSQMTRQAGQSRAMLDELRQVASPESVGGAYLNYIGALLDMDEGCLEMVLEQLGRAHTIADRTGDPGLNVEVRLGMCRYHRLQGDLAEAWEWANDALGVARRSGYAIREADSLQECGWVNWLRGDPTAAEADLQRAAETYTLNHAAFGRTCVSLLLAAMLDQQKHPEALPAWLDCVRLIRAHEYYFLLERERALAYPLIASSLSNLNPAVVQAGVSLLEHLQRVPPPPLKIRTLGGWRIQAGARVINKSALRRRRSGELLGMLLISPGRMLSFDQVAEALWPDKDLETAQALFHHATSTLRRAFEPDLPEKFPSRYLEVGDGQVTLRLPPTSTVDFQIFTAHCRNGEWDAGVAVYSGEFLPEYRFAEWSLLHRQALAQDAQRSLLNLAESRLAQRHFMDALGASRQVLALEPWLERAVFIGMQACLGLGDRPGALRLYKTLEKALRDELGVEPQADLQTLYRSLLKR